MNLPAVCHPRSLVFVALTMAVTSVLAITARPLAAQDGDSTVAQVQRLVNGGNRAGARRLADSLLAAATDGTPAYAEALFARAISSSSAVEAERDYLRVSVEYSLSPRAADATMMVAQLKLARSDRIGARRNFERLVRQHPTSPQVAKAAFWAGRLAIEDGDTGHGCPLLGTARSVVPASDVELANQVEYYAQRCSAAELAGPPPAPASVAPPVTGGRTTVSPSRTDARPPRPAPVPTPPPPVVEDSAVAPPVTEVPVAEAPAAPPAPPVPPGKEYTVQVAAFPKQRDADALAQVLTQRGFSVRVLGTAPPYRVRVGRFATREEAEQERARMKASRINGVVVEAEKP